MEDILAIFYRYYCFSKDDLIQCFKLTMDSIENDKISGYTKGSRQQKLKLCKKFLTTLEKCKLPTLIPEQWQYYEYEFTGNALELSLCEANNCEFELTEDGKDISTMAYSVESVLLRTEYEYVTIDEFAKIHEVTSKTVQNWIRRGKLRNAKMLDKNDWRIPSVDDKPSRYYNLIQYEIPEPLRIDEFPLVSAADNIMIHQDFDDPKVYKCSFTNRKSGFRQDMKLNRKDVEELEFALISSGKAKPCSSCGWVPCFERVDDEFTLR
jgi:hypothetical protein